jgi:hypothetical protein
MRYPKAAQTVQTSAIHRRGWLVELIKKHGWRHGAELGACKGKTLFFLVHHCPELHMIGVDAWTEQIGNPLEDYTQPNWKHEWAAKMVKDRAAKYNRVRIIHDFSVNAAAEVADASLDFVFIDADHGKVAEDIQAWRPKLKPNGKLIGHDINWPTVKTDVDRLIKDYDIGPDNCWIEK